MGVLTIVLVALPLIAIALTLWASARYGQRHSRLPAVGLAVVGLVLALCGMLLSLS
jgi:threonine/homoserine/homoserine lactone efflux protein